MVCSGLDVFMGVLLGEPNKTFEAGEQHQALNSLTRFPF